MFHFCKVAAYVYLGEVDIFHTRVKNLFLLKTVQNYENRLRFSKLIITNVLPPFYGSQYIKQSKILTKHDVSDNKTDPVCGDNRPSKSLILKCGFIKISELSQNARRLKSFNITDRVT